MTCMADNGNKSNGDPESTHMAAKYGNKIRSIDDNIFRFGKYFVYLHDNPK